MSETKKKPVSCKMDVETYKRLKIHCVEHGLKIGEYIGRLVTQEMDKVKKEQKEKQNER